MVEKLTEDQRKVLIIWGFLGLFLAILLIIIGSKKLAHKINYELDKDYVVVKNYSRYYTISKIIDKYYTAINDGRYDAAVNMLDDKYKKDNNISSANVRDTLKYDVKVSFNGSLMCSKRFAKGYTSYYVSGNVIGSNVDKEFDKVYYEVVLNEMEMRFSIKKIDASTFGGACNA